MKTAFLTRRRVLLGQEVQEPTVLAFVLGVMGFAILLGAAALGIAFLPAFGHLAWIFAAVAALLAGLVLAFRVPPDYQQGESVRIMFIHVSAAWMSMFV